LYWCRPDPRFDVLKRFDGGQRNVHRENVGQSELLIKGDDREQMLRGGELLGRQVTADRSSVGDDFLR
jgi:hypothetical protein